MITSCELCAKVAIEEAIREEERRKEAIKIEAEEREVAKIFAENLIAPIIANLTKIPNKLFIGYSEQSERLFLSKGVGKEWKVVGFTSRRYKKLSKLLTHDTTTENPVGRCLRFDYLNDYLLNFGFTITYKKETVEKAFKYESSPNCLYDITITGLYLSAVCPEENF